MDTLTVVFHIELAYSCQFSVYLQDSEFAVGTMTINKLESENNCNKLTIGSIEFGLITGSSS